MTSVTVTLKARSVEVQRTEFLIYLTHAHATLPTLNVYIKIDSVALKQNLNYNPTGVKICKYYQ